MHNFLIALFVSRENIFRFKLGNMFLRFICHIFKHFRDLVPRNCILACVRLNCQVLNLIVAFVNSYCLQLLVLERRGDPTRPRSKLEEWSVMHLFYFRLYHTGFSH